MEPYSKKVMQHFKHPHNFGKMKNADGIGKVGNPVCGDVMYIYIKVSKNKKNEEIIKNIKFETFGCVAAIAVSSMVTDLVRGKTIKYANNLTKDNIVEALGGLPQIKVHCSMLALDGLHAAIKEFNDKKVK